MPGDNVKIESAQRTDAEVAETNNQNNVNQVKHMKEWKIQ